MKSAVRPQEKKPAPVTIEPISDKLLQSAREGIPTDAKPKKKVTINPQPQIAPPPVVKVAAPPVATLEKEAPPQEKKTPNVKEAFSRDEQCVVCHESIKKSGYIGFACDHFVHLACSNSKTCPACAPVKDVPADALVAVDHGDDIKCTQLLEQLYGPQGVVLVRAAPVDVPDLSLEQKTKIIPGKMSFVFAATKIVDREYLFTNKHVIDINRLLSASVTLQQMYHKLGLQTLDDLCMFGFQKTHLARRDLIPPSDIANLFRADKSILQEKIGLLMVDLFALDYDIPDFAALGWTIQNMIDAGLTIDKFAYFAKCARVPRRLVKYLKMTKAHLSIFKITTTNMRIWGWNKDAVKEVFKLSDDDLRNLGGHKRSPAQPSQPQKTTKPPIRKQ